MRYHQRLGNGMHSSMSGYNPIGFLFGAFYYASRKSSCHSCADVNYPTGVFLRGQNDVCEICDTGQCM
jgi:hypothetical protein